VSVLEQMRYIWTQGMGLSGSQRKEQVRTFAQTGAGARGFKGDPKATYKGSGKDSVSNYPLDFEEALEVKDLPAADADEHDGLQDRPKLDAVVGRFGRCTRAHQCQECRPRGVKRRRGERHALSRCNRSRTTMYSCSSLTASSAAESCRISRSMGAVWPAGETA
jgi:hypothetical protein